MRRDPARWKAGAANPKGYPKLERILAYYGVMQDDVSRDSLMDDVMHIVAAQPYEHKGHAMGALMDDDDWTLFLNSRDENTSRAQVDVALRMLCSDGDVVAWNRNGKRIRVSEDDHLGYVEGYTDSDDWHVWQSFEQIDTIRFRVAVCAEPDDCTQALAARQPSPGLISKRE